MLNFRSWLYPPHSYVSNLYAKLQIIPLFPLCQRALFLYIEHRDTKAQSLLFPCQSEALLDVFLSRRICKSSVTKSSRLLCSDSYCYISLFNVFQVGFRFTDAGLGGTLQARLCLVIPLQQDQGYASGVVGLGAVARFLQVFQCVPPLSAPRAHWLRSGLPPRHRGTCGPLCRTHG